MHRAPRPALYALAALWLLSSAPATATPAPVPLVISPRLAGDLALNAPTAPRPIMSVTVDSNPHELRLRLPRLAEPDSAIQGLAAPLLLKLARDAGNTPRVIRTRKRYECVTFARAMTGLDLFGDARTWWAKARGLYNEITRPRPGAVMVFARSRRLRLGHVAVVQKIVSSREVRVDQANWGNDGRINVNAPVVDVSPNNDWSMVRVWDSRIRALGTHIYRLKGFLTD